MRKPAAKTGFASGGVTCKLGALCFYSSSVLVDSFVHPFLPAGREICHYAKPQTVTTSSSTNQFGLFPSTDFCEYPGIQLWLVGSLFQSILPPPPNTRYPIPSLSASRTNSPTSAVLKVNMS